MNKLSIIYILFLFIPFSSIKAASCLISHSSEKIRLSTHFSPAVWNSQRSYFTTNQEFPVKFSRSKPYVYPTFDTSFKYLFKNEKIRIGFFSTFLPRLPIISSEIINTLADPAQKYDGTMVFMCERKGGNFSLVELQIAPDFSVPDPLIRYSAQFNRHQRLEKRSGKKIEEIIRLGLLGHEEIKRVNDVYGIRLKEVSIMTSHSVPNNQAEMDWETFFKAGPGVTKKWVQSHVRTPIVIKAFKKLQFNKLPEKVKQAYIEENKIYQNNCL